MIPTEHPYPFDPTHGFGLDALRAVRGPDAPPGFDDLWRDRYDAALRTDPRPRLSGDTSTHPKWRIHDVTYTSTGSFEIGGWLLVPRDGPVKRGLVVGHGYGGREQPDLDVPVDQTAVLFPCFRGLSRSRRPSISEDPRWHVLHDIDQPERYILRGCIEDLWLAVSALLALYPGLGGRIGYSGISFGGGIGALALPFDARIDRGHLVVPTFGNIPLWLTLPSTGSAAAVQDYRLTREDVAETLRVFDAASAASRISIPMLIAVARFDPAVAPPCQFSIANALPTSNDNEIVILDAGHHAYPGQDEQQARLTAKVMQFFGAT